MRLEARLLLVIPILVVLVLVLWPPGAEDASLDPRSRVSAAGVGVRHRPADAPAPRPPATAPRRTTRDERPGLRRSAPRSRSYDAVLVAAGLAPRTIELADLRRLWSEAADRGAPHEAVAGLLAIARGNTDRPVIAHAALDAREDLIALQTRRAAGLAADADAPGAWTTAAEVGGEATEPTTTEDRLDRLIVDEEQVAELAHVLRYGSDSAEATHALALLGLMRTEQASETLLDAVDHPGADQRLAAVNAVWRAAADGDASMDRVREVLRRARHDTNPRIASLAETAALDLDRHHADEAAALARVDAGRAAHDDCPVEICAPAAPRS